jgi:hypothetical protein
VPQLLLLSATGSIVSWSAADKCASDIEKQTRAMWSDLMKKAGTGDAVGFGGGGRLPADSSGFRAKVRKATEKADSPDLFSCPWRIPNQAATGVWYMPRQCFRQL